MTLSETPVADVLIIGGGHAGLSAALTLYRALHTTVIFDAKKPRNSYSTPLRLTSTWEHQSPEAMRETSRRELLEAGLTTFVDIEATAVERTEDGLFEVTDGTGRKWLGQKVLLATGARDCFPGVAGYDDVYARGIYPCMFQFGFELRGSPSAGLLAMDGLANAMHAMALARDGHKFADTMTIYTNGNPSLASDISGHLSHGDISVDDRKIARLSRGEGSSVVVEFEDGLRKQEAFLVHRPLTSIDRVLVDQLGLTVTKMGDVDAAPPFCKTNVPGVYAAGDCASMAKTVPNAMNMGAYAGCGLARELPKRAM